VHVVLIEFRNATPYPVQLANALSQLCQVTLMLPEAALRFSDSIDKERVNLKFFKMPRYRQPGQLAAMARSLRKQLKALKPDIVHITAWHVIGTPGLGLFAPYPLVATVHDISRHPGDTGLRGIPSFLYPWQWRWAKQVIVHATTARQQLLNQYGCQPERIVLFFGRIWEYKGLKYLIEAEPLITKAIPNARIIIAGYGECFEKYQQAMVNSHHFEVHNYRIPDEQVAHFFQQASVVALPYIEASQSGVVSVAYAFGKPVVASRVGGLPDVVIEGQTGLLVPPADTLSLAEAIITLLKDTPLRQKMGQQAQQFAETELSWQRIAQKTLKVYYQARCWPT